MQTKIAIIGYGSMGSMLFEKFIASGLVPEDMLYVANRTFGKIEPLGERYKAVHLCRTNREAVGQADIVFFCVRPSDLKSLFEEVKDLVTKEKYLISLNGSVQFSQIEKLFPENRITKIIPSITASVNESQTLVTHNGKVADFSFVKSLLKTFGNVIELPETELGMGSELVSCMPGFIAAIFNEIATSAQKHTSLDRQQIVDMLLSTLTATGKLMQQNAWTFEQVISRVATKGGITEEGVKVVEARLPAAMDELFEKTLEKRRLTAENAKKQFAD